VAAHHEFLAVRYYVKFGLYGMSRLSVVRNVVAPYRQTFELFGNVASLNSSG